MSKSLAAIFLSVILAVTSIGFATARGKHPDVGRDMVICTGVGMVVMKIGPDGQPLQENIVCPDAISLFTVAFYTEKPPVRDWTITLLSAPDAAVIWRVHDVLTPAARGPPLDV